MDRDVTCGAVLKSRSVHVVERRRLRAGTGQSQTGGMTFQAELRNGGTFELARIRGSVRFVAAHAVAHRHGAVLEDERAVFFSVAADAHGLARRGHPDAVAPGAAVSLMAGAALHPALHPVTERLAA